MSTLRDEVEALKKKLEERAGEREQGRPRDGGRGAPEQVAAPHQLSGMPPLAASRTRRACGTAALPG